MKAKYWAEVLKPIENAPGTWNSLQVGVFTLKDGKPEKVGEYKRNYHSLMDTFCWFTVAGKDYALYSPDYSSTRIMSLSDCKDLGGEDRAAHGFCPTDYYIPCFDEYEFDKSEDKRLSGHKYRVYEPDEEGKSGDGVTIIKAGVHEPFGFIAGCVWGDDHSWKIQYLDLSEADKGIVKRDERFGYIELPKDIRLKDAIDCDCFEQCGRVKIATASYYTVKTGKVLD